MHLGLNLAHSCTTMFGQKLQYCCKILHEFWRILQKKVQTQISIENAKKNIFLIYHTHLQISEEIEFSFPTLIRSFSFDPIHGQ